MGRIISSCKKIAGVRFEHITNKRARSDAVKAVCIDGAFYVLTKAGRIFTNSELGRKAMFAGTGSDYHGVVALRELGIITADEQRDHGEGKRRHDANYARYVAVTRAAKAFAEVGIELTPKQKEKLQIMKDSIDFDDLPWFVQKEAQRKIGADGAKA